MKKLLFILLIFTGASLFSQTENIFYKILIREFENLDAETETDFMRNLIIDTAKKELTTKFDVISYEEFSALLVTDDKEKILDQASIEKIDFFCSGYYLKRGDLVKVTLKFYDVKTSLLIYTKDMYCENFVDLYGIIANETRDLMKFAFDYINENKTKSSQKSDYRKKDIVSLDDENFIFCQTGLVYSNLNFHALSRDVSNDIDISSYKNRQTNYFSPMFNFEIYKSYNDNLHGFGIMFEIPIDFQIPRFFMNNKLSLSYNLGLKKKYFFKFGLELVNLSYSKYSTSSGSSINVSFLGIGFAFNFRYLIDVANIYFDIGFELTPTMPFIKNRDNSGFVPFNFIVGNSSLGNSVYIPISISNAFGYFLNKNIGIYISNNIYIIIADYKTKTYDGVIFDYGNDLGIGARITLGLIFKSFFN
ncbi:MAG: hypothetical protein KA885_06650 [Spirochaetes bacterium]|nr:hypothetical protein [Spirochaetota bacterium]